VSDLEIRNYERALRRRGWFRFVVFEDSTRPFRDGAERATLAQWCGDPGYKNLLRRHVWAVPVYTLEDVAAPDKILNMESIFDLVERAVLRARRSCALLRARGGVDQHGVRAARHAEEVVSRRAGGSSCRGRATVAGEVRRLRRSRRRPGRLRLRLSEVRPENVAGDAMSFRETS